MNIKSQATLTYNYSLGGANFEGSAISNLVSTEIRTTDIIIKKIASCEYYKPTDIITYTLIITNRGNYKASNVLIKDSLKMQDYIDGSFKSTFIGDTSDVVFSNTEALSFAIKDLTPNTICLISYRVIVNSALTTSDEADSTLSVESEEFNTLKIDNVKLTQGYAKVVCSKKALPDYAYINTDLIYQITLKNVGTTAAYNVNVADHLPETFLLDENGVIFNDQNLEYNYSNNQLGFTIDKIMPDEELQVYVKGRIYK